MVVGGNRAPSPSRSFRKMRCCLTYTLAERGAEGASTASRSPESLAAPLAWWPLTEQRCVSLEQEKDPGCTASCSAGFDTQWTPWRFIWRCYRWLCTPYAPRCKKQRKKQTKKKTATTRKTNKNKIRSNWMRLFVRAEMDAVKEPGRPAGRSHAVSLSAVQWMWRPISAGPRQYLSLYGATALDRSMGASPLRICHFCIIFILTLFLFCPSNFFSPRYVVRNMSGFSLPGREGRPA